MVPLIPSISLLTQFSAAKVRYALAKFFFVQKKLFNTMTSGGRDYYVVFLPHPLLKGSDSVNFVWPK